MYHYGMIYIEKNVVRKGNLSMPANTSGKPYGDVVCTLRTVVAQARQQLFDEGQRGLILPYIQIARVTGIDRKVLVNLINDDTAAYDRKVFGRLIAFFGGLAGSQGTLGIEHLLRYVPPTAGSTSAPPLPGGALAAPRFVIAHDLPQDYGTIHCLLGNVLTALYGKRSSGHETSSYQKWAREVGHTKDTVWNWVNDRLTRYPRDMLAYWCYLSWSKGYAGEGDGTIASILKYVPPPATSEREPAPPRHGLLCGADASAS